MVSQTTLRSISFRKRTILTHTQSLPECRSTSCCTCRARAQTAYFFTCSVQSSPHRGSRRMGARRRWSAATTQVVPEREEAPPAPRPAPRLRRSSELGARKGAAAGAPGEAALSEDQSLWVGERTGMGRGEERGGAQGRPLSLGEGVGHPAPQLPPRCHLRRKQGPCSGRVARQPRGPHRPRPADAPARLLEPVRPPRPPARPAPGTRRRRRPQRQAPLSSGGRPRETEGLEGQGPVGPPVLTLSGACTGAAQGQLGLLGVLGGCHAGGGPCCAQRPGWGWGLG